MIRDVVDDNVRRLGHIRRERVDNLVAVNVVRGQRIWLGRVHVVLNVILVGVVVAVWHVDVVIVIVRVFWLCRRRFARCASIIRNAELGRV